MKHTLSNFKLVMLTSLDYKTSYQKLQRGFRPNWYANKNVKLMFLHFLQVVRTLFFK